MNPEIKAYELIVDLQKDKIQSLLEQIKVLERKVMALELEKEMKS